MSDGAQSQARTDITVAFLTKNGGGLLKRALEAVREQDTTRSVEILAVDSGSTDDTLANLRQADARVIEIDASDFDFGRTRDLAYSESHSEIIVNLSQDAIPAHPLWLDNLVKPFSEGEIGVASGSSIPDPDREYAQFAWERNGYFYFTREMQAYRSKFGKGISFSNSAVSREVWSRFRFDETPLGEDFQFQQKLNAADIGIAFPSGAEVLHHHQYTLGSLYRRCRDEGQALRILGCPYKEADLFLDLIRPKERVQWLREIRHGRLKTGAEFWFPTLRPIAVYMGSRFGTRTS